MRYVLGLLLSLLVLTGCREEEASGPPSMEFTVDPALLGDKVVLPEQDVQFQPPVSWRAVEASNRESLEQALPVSDSLAFRPLHIFLDETSGSVLSVAEFSFDEGLPFEEQMKRYGDVLAQRFAGDSLRQTLFLKEGLPVAQFLVQPAGLVNFKLVFEAPYEGLIQFDYVVPRAQYPREVRAIESSIGSIRRTP